MSRSSRSASSPMSCDSSNGFAAGKYVEQPTDQLEIAWPRSNLLGVIPWVDGPVRLTLVEQLLRVSCSFVS